MWLFVPCPSAPESAALTLGYESPSPAYAPFVTLSGKLTRRPFSWHGWRSRSWISLLSGTISRPFQSQRSLERYISSLEAFPVSRTLPQANASGRKTAATSGQTLFEFSADSEPKPSFLRTSETSSPIETASLVSSLTLPASGSMRSGVCTAAPAWEPPTSASGSSSWPTPVASSGSFNKSVGSTKRRPSLRAIGAAGFRTAFSETLATTGANWDTPRASMASWDRQKDGTIRPGLPNQAKSHYPPKARDYKESGGARKSPNLSDLAASGHLAVTQSCGEESSLAYGPPRLNSTFVEWLMGFPIGWSLPTAIAETDFTHWATQLALQSPQWLGSTLLAGPLQHFPTLGDSRD